MEIHLAPDAEAQLQHLASSQGKDAAQVVEFVESVECGIVAADRGEFVESNEVWANVEKILQS